MRGVFGKRVARPDPTIGWNLGVKSISRILLRKTNRIDLQDRCKLSSKRERKKRGTFKRRTAPIAVAKLSRTTSIRLQVSMHAAARCTLSVLRDRIIADGILGTGRVLLRSIYDDT